MDCIKQTSRTGELAAKYFGPDYHCAEAVTKAVLETLGHDAGVVTEAVAHATAFGGGFGKSFCEACGALSGGLLAIGHVHGRREPGADWDLPAEMGAELRQSFVGDFGTTHCATLRERFGKDQMDECRKIVAKTADALVNLLGEELTGDAALDSARASVCGVGQACPCKA